MKGLIRRSTFFAAAFGASLLALAPGASAAEPDLVYQGRLQDKANKPLSGIFPLTFSFYRSTRATRATWQETRYVAVEDGVYQIELGSETPVPKNLPLDRLYLGVALQGGAELVRERFAVEHPAEEPSAVEEDEEPAAAASPEAAQPARRAGTKPRGSSVKYAEEAGFAYEAEVANSANTVGGMKADDIKALVKNAGKKPTVGAEQRVMERVGGSGGAPYTTTCPAGYVVTGIRGGAAAYIDSFTLICSPLE